MLPAFPLSRIDDYQLFREFEPGSGWDYFLRSDLREILLGSNEVLGYYEREKAMDLGKLDLDTRWLFGAVQENIEYAGYHGPGLGRRFLVDYWRAYSKYCDGRRICLHADDGEDGQWIFLPYSYRGSRDYQRRTYHKVKRIKGRWKEHRGGVSLRLSPRAVGSPYQVFKKIKEIQNKFLTWLFKRIGRRIPYIWSIEPTKRGYAHFHLIFMSPWLYSKEAIDKWWREHGLGTEAGVWIERFRGSPKKVISYVMKYLMKTHESPEWNAILTLTRKRSWGMSRNFSLLAPPKGVEQFQLIWRFMGTVTAYEAEVIEEVLGYDNPPDPENMLELALYYKIQKENGRDP